MAQVLSPLPGTFYIRPDPESAPYKAPGDPVAADATVGLIEVMKTFIEVKAGADGTFTAYIAGDAAPVQAGEALADLAN